MPRRDELYLADVVEACRDVVRFVANLSLHDWLTNDLVRYARWATYLRAPPRPAPALGRSPTHVICSTSSMVPPRTTDVAEPVAVLVPLQLADADVAERSRETVRAGYGVL